VGIITNKKCCGLADLSKPGVAVAVADSRPQAPSIASLWHLNESACSSCRVHSHEGGGGASVGEQAAWSALTARAA